jgi:hypothetical protein
VQNIINKIPINAVVCFCKVNFNYKKASVIPDSRHALQHLMSNNDILINIPSWYKTG